MWKILLISSLLSFAAKAERQGAVERMELEAQDAEECATAPGNPTSIEECREAKAAKSEAFNSCLSDESIKKFERASATSMRMVREQAEIGSTLGRSLHNVWAGLIYSHLVKEGWKSDEFGGTAKDVAGRLKQEGFVDLAKCKDWEKRLKDTKRIPLGAVLVYESKDHKKFDIRQKTPSGCIGSGEPLTPEEEARAGKHPATKESAAVLMLLKDKAAEEHVRKAECLNLSGFKLTGVYVKNVN